MHVRPLASFTGTAKTRCRRSYIFLVARGSAARLRSSGTSGMLVLLVGAQVAFFHTVSAINPLRTPRPTLPCLSHCPRRASLDLLSGRDPYAAVLTRPCIWREQTGVPIKKTPFPQWHTR